VFFVFLDVIFVLLPTSEAVKSCRGRRAAAMVAAVARGAAVAAALAASACLEGCGVLAAREDSPALRTPSPVAVECVNSSGGSSFWTARKRGALLKLLRELDANARPRKLQVALALGEDGGASCVVGAFVHQAERGPAVCFDVPNSVTHPAVDALASTRRPSRRQPSSPVDIQTAGFLSSRRGSSSESTRSRSPSRRSSQSRPQPASLAAQAKAPPSIFSFSDWFSDLSLGELRGELRDCRETRVVEDLDAIVVRPKAQAGGPENMSTEVVVLVPREAGAAVADEGAWFLHDSTGGCRSLPSRPGMSMHWKHVTGGRSALWLNVLVQVVHTPTVEAVRIPTEYRDIFVGYMKDPKTAEASLAQVYMPLIDLFTQRTATWESRLLLRNFQAVRKMPKREVPRIAELRQFRNPDGAEALVLGTFDEVVDLWRRTGRDDKMLSQPASPRQRHGRGASVDLDKAGHYNGR